MRKMETLNSLPKVTCSEWRSHSLSGEGLSQVHLPGWQELCSHRKHSHRGCRTAMQCRMLYRLSVKCETDQYIPMTFKDIAIWDYTIQMMVIHMQWWHCQQEKVNYEVIFRNIYLSNISVKKDLELSWLAVNYLQTQNYIIQLFANRIAQLRAGAVWLTKHLQSSSSVGSYFLWHLTPAEVGVLWLSCPWMPLGASALSSERPWIFPTAGKCQWNGF